MGRGRAGAGLRVGSSGVEAKTGARNALGLRVASSGVEEKAEGRSEVVSLVFWVGMATIVDVELGMIRGGRREDFLELRA
jgi:hypothetical protein